MFFLQPYIRLYRNSEFQNIIMENGIEVVSKPQIRFKGKASRELKAERTR